MTRGRMAYTGNPYWLSDDGQVRVEIDHRLITFDVIVDVRDAEAPLGWRCVKREPRAAPRVGEPRPDFDKIARQEINLVIMGITR